MKSCLPLLTTTIAAVLLAASTTYIAFKALDRPLVGIDDANIFFSYAQNIATGKGFVYAANDERVEGFTSLLWVLVCAGARFVSDRPELVLLMVTLGLTVATVTMTAWHVQTVGRDDAERNPTSSGSVWPTLLLFAWCFLSPAFICWMTLTLMDVALWTTIVTGGTLATAGCVGQKTERWDKRVWLLSAAVAIAILCRPESFLLAPTWIAAAMFANFTATRQLGQTVRRFALPIAVCGGSILALEVFRLKYFGYPLPNTFYAKVSPSPLYNLRQGLGYLEDFLLDNRLVPLCLCLALVGVWRSIRQLTLPSGSSAEKERSLRQIVLSVCVLAAMLPPVLMGGDHFKWHRFFQPVWPLLFAVAFDVLSGARAAFRHAREMVAGDRVSAAIFGIGLVAVVAVSPAVTWPQLRQFHGGNLQSGGLGVQFDVAIRGREVGTMLDQVQVNGSRPSLGVIYAGGIAVTYHGPVIDLLGLNNVAMGHSAGERKGKKNHAAFNRDVFMSLRPDLIIVGRSEIGNWGEDVELFEKVLGGLLRSREFRDRYVPIEIKLPQQFPSAENVALFLWARIDMIGSLQHEGYAVKIHSLPEG